MLEKESDVARVVPGVNEEAGLLRRPLALVGIVDVTVTTRIAPLTTPPHFLIGL